MIMMVVVTRIMIIRFVIYFHACLTARADFRARIQNNKDKSNKQKMKKLNQLRVFKFKRNLLYICVALQTVLTEARLAGGATEHY
jgi:hypothetical protein